MLKKYPLVLMLGLLSVISIGCATIPSSQQEVAKYVAKFDYTPASQETAGSADVTFTVGNLTYNHDRDTWIHWYESAQLANLPDAMKRDLSKLLVAKGFNVRGPFDSYDLIPFPDKKAVDLWLIPTLELSTMVKDAKDDYGDIWLTSRLSTGNVEVSGKLILEAREIVTRELMWSKTIPLTKLEFSYSSHYALGAPSGTSDIIINEIAKGIEKQYPDLMATILNLIYPEEMRIIKKQCQELKGKKGY